MANAHFAAQKIKAFNETLKLRVGTHVKVPRGPVGIGDLNPSSESRKALRTWIWRETGILEKLINGQNFPEPFAEAMMTAATQLYRAKAYDEARFCFGKIVRAHLMHHDDFSNLSSDQIAVLLRDWSREQKEDPENFSSTTLPIWES
ncbi:hypothetical protein AAMO2058_000111900 [Amorphochlora amoebiformis]